MNFCTRVAVLFGLVAGLHSQIPTTYSQANLFSDDGEVVVDAFPSPNIKPALAEKLTKLDAQSAKIKHLRASFSQEKRTPLLRKPLLSNGVLLALGPRMRWNTTQPHASVMLIDQRPDHNEIFFYYEDDALLEIHPLNHQLGRLAGFPLPRFRDLAEHFSIDEDPKPLTDQRGTGLGLVLIPTDEASKKHLQKIRVLVDPENGLVWKVEITEENEGRTLLTFQDLDTTSPVLDGEIELDIPTGTEIVRTSPSQDVPLE